MSLAWTDVYEIAIELSEQYTNIDPQYVNFVDLRDWIMALPNFKDDSDRCSEQVLEAIQAAWIDELKP